MIAIITGDIINSRTIATQEWMLELKSVLNKYGSEPKTWEIYRGDSFQLEVNPMDALKTTILIKAAIKQFKALDVRMGIGIGEKTYTSEKITESNGSAFINSGRAFENLKKRTLSIQTEQIEFDKTINIMLDLATFTMNNWATTTALLIKTILESDNTLKQKALAKLLNKKQSNTSRSLKRSGFYEIQKMIQYYQEYTKYL